MKFDVVIGNPPYQESIENRGEQPPLYNLFYEAAFSISDTVTFITPARFLFDAGKTPSSWNKKMLNDPHFKVVEYYPNSKDVFDNVDIKGGVAITYRDLNHDYGEIEMFIPEKDVKRILDKVKKMSSSNMSEIWHSNTSYKYSNRFFLENPEFKSRVSGGSSRYLSSSVFNVFPEAFHLKKPVDSECYIKIIGRHENIRCIRYFNERYLSPPNNFKKFKVYLASSSGTGKMGETLSLPILGKPYEGATETFVSFGSFDTEIEAERLIKYFKSKFVRLLLGTKKVTQGNKNKKVWTNVPLQNLTQSSDIDWSKSINEIDQQLYMKYGLSQDEIDFIENNVKEME